MVEDIEQVKYYVMDKYGNVRGPHYEERAHGVARYLDGEIRASAPHRVVTIVATEVPEPPKVSRTVTRQADGKQVQFRDKDLWYKQRDCEWEPTNATIQDWIKASVMIPDYAFVRDFAALCEEVLGGGHRYNRGIDFLG